MITEGIKTFAIDIHTWRNLPEAWCAEVKARTLILGTILWPNSHRKYQVSLFTCRLPILGKSFSLVACINKKGSNFQWLPNKLLHMHGWDLELYFPSGCWLKRDHIRIIHQVSLLETLHSLSGNFLWDYCTLILDKVKLSWWVPYLMTDITPMVSSVVCWYFGPIHALFWYAVY